MDSGGEVCSRATAMLEINNFFFVYILEAPFEKA